MNRRVTIYGEVKQEMRSRRETECEQREELYAIDLKPCDLSMPRLKLK